MYSFIIYYLIHLPAYVIRILQPGWIKFKYGVIILKFQGQFSPRWWHNFWIEEFSQIIGYPLEWRIGTAYNIQWFLTFLENYPFSYIWKPNYPQNCIKISQKIFQKFCQIICHKYLSKNLSKNMSKKLPKSLSKNLFKNVSKKSYTKICQKDLSKFMNLQKFYFLWIRAAAA